MKATITERVPPGAVFDPARGFVYAERPALRDDLTCIRGIDSDLQQRLNRHGAYTFDQIAAWKDKHVLEYAKLLSYPPERIEGDYWVWQAQRLREERERLPDGAATGPAAGLPATLWRTAILLMLALLLGILFAQWLDLNSARSFTGTIRAHTVLVKATRDAVITRLFVSQGDAVKSRQDVVVLRDENLKAGLQHLEQEVARLLSELVKTEAQADLDLKWRIQKLDREILEARLLASNRIQPQIETDGRGNVRFREVSYSELTEAAGHNGTMRIDGQNVGGFAYFTPQAGSDGPVQAVIIPRTEPAESAGTTPERRRLCELRIAELEQLKQELGSRASVAAGVAVAQTRLAQAREKLHRLSSQVQQFALRTRRSGLVSRVFQEEGATVHRGDRILQIIDRQRQHIDVVVPSRSVSAFKAGSVVAIVFPGEIQRTGRVESIPPQVADETDHGETILQVTVVPSGKLWPPVPIGSTVEVRVRR